MLDLTEDLMQHYHWWYAGHLTEMIKKWVPIAPYMTDWTETEINHLETRMMSY